MSNLIPRPAQLPSEILREGGWCQGDLEAGSKHCLIGAFQKAVTGDAYHMLAEPGYVALRKATRYGHRRYAAVSLWNDAASRRKAQVIAAAERAEVILGWRRK